MKKVIIIPLLLVLVLGIYFGYNVLTKKDKATRYLTAAVAKGTLIVSVSGSGQVTVLDEVDIKPKVSGELIALYINKDEEVKAGQLLAKLDTKNAQQAIRDAEIVLDNVKANLEELLSQPDAKSLLQAENALKQAERDLDKAKENYEDIEIDAERSLANAYEDGYSAVSTTFFKLSDYIKNLQDVLGTEQDTEKYIDNYKLILGSDSSFIQRFIDDYDQAEGLFIENSAFFRTVYREDDRDIIYQLIGDTFETTKAISRTLESARHMFDAIVVVSYEHFTVSSHIDKMRPKIASDISSVNSNITSLERIKDTIDDTNKNTPEKIEDAEWALQSAQEKFDEKKLALEELIAGADSQDIKSQQNTVLQKEDTLLDAKEKLANCSIRAPFNGVIAELNDKVKKGDSVTTNTVLATLITKQKIAEMTLNEIDAANVKVGQKATLAFDALPELTLSGKIMEVDVMGVVTQGVVSYGVKIAWDTEEEQIKPGMSVTADIITDAKEDVLVLPNSAIKSKRDFYYVELIKAPEKMSQHLLANISGTILPEPPKPQPVEIGLSNDLSTEIISGLKEGDLVVAQTISSKSTPKTGSGTQMQGMMKMMR